LKTEDLIIENQNNLRQIVKDEFLKCATDPVYFFKKYAKISHPTKGKILFDLYPFQEDTLHQLQQNRYNIILKSRQMGISTLTAGHALHEMMFNEDFKILVIATTQEVAKNLVEKVQLMFEFMPNFLKQGLSIVNNNKLSLTFSNGSSIKAVSSSPEAARSSALSLLICDEFAFIEAAEKIWISAQMTLATGGKCIILSTPNGTGNTFHELWTKSEVGESVEEGMETFNTINLPWYLHPDRDQKWRDNQDHHLGKRQAAQECDCDFLTSGHTVVEADIIQEYSQKAIDPIEKRGIGGDLWIWKYPEVGKDYIVIQDPARGDGEDNSGLQVIEVESCEQVAEYRGKIDTQTFGRMGVAVATEYNNALLIIDNKNVGWSTVQVALDLGYKNLYYSYKNDPFLDENIHLRKNYDLKNKEDMIPGLTTTTRIRPVLISKLVMYFEDRTPIIHSKRFINELRTFVWLDGKPQAQRGQNDDLVMCWAMGMYIRDTALRMRQMGIELVKNAIKHVHKPVYKSQPVGQTQWEMRTGKNNERESLKWLL